jgi:transposase
MREQLFRLTRSEREALERRYKQTETRRISERIHAILLLDAGQNRNQTARILHVNPKTITRWIRIYVRDGIETLCTLPTGNQEAALTAAEQAQLRTWLDGGVRTTKEAIAWVEATFQVAYTESGMRKLLQRMGYRYKQPAVVPNQADPQAQAAWLKGYVEKRGP